MSEDERSPTSDALSQQDWLCLLEEGSIEVEGRMPWSSNATFLTTLRDGEKCGRAIYKPGAGERELWDFPDGLYRYEVAAYELSDALNYAIVPETIRRVDAPYGEGSLQRFIDANFEQHYFTFLEEERYWPQLRLIAGFDLLLNNADRKGGHLLVDSNDHIFGIDNGLCFHPEPKLRTVMWDFAGEDIPEEVLVGARTVLDGVPSKLAALLSAAEHVALLDRARWITDVGQFPEPDLDGRPYPWPRI